MVWLPPPLRRRLDERDAFLWSQAFAAGQESVRAAQARDRYRFVLVVTFGRSGSTLVQGLLNALPRTLVRGENNLFVLPIYRSLAAVREFRRLHLHHRTSNSASAFYGLNAIRRGPFLDALNRVVVASVRGGLPANDFDVLGFKEVLWHRIEPEETEEFFTFLDQALPGVRYVLNTRDPADALKSGFWLRTDEERARSDIERVLDIQQHLRETRADRVFDVRYEELTDGGEGAERTLRGLAEFVTGEAPDEATLAGMRELLSVGHGPRPFGKSHSGARDEDDPEDDAEDDAVADADA